MNERFLGKSVGLNQSLSTNETIAPPDRKEIHTKIAQLSDTICTLETETNRLLGKIEFIQTPAGPVSGPSDNKNVRCMSQLSLLLLEAQERLFDLAARVSSASDRLEI